MNPAKALILLASRHPKVVCVISSEERDVAL
jgi:hypothetical protein